MVSPAARPCGSPGWTLNFSMRDPGQKIALIPRSITDGRLLENTDCSVLFNKDCRGLLLLRTDEWHSKLQTQASEGALHRLDITVNTKSDSTVRCCFATACYCVSLQFGFFLINRASSDGMGPSETISSFVREGWRTEVILMHPLRQQLTQRDQRHYL